MGAETAPPRFSAERWKVIDAEGARRGWTRKQVLDWLVDQLAANRNGTVTVKRTPIRSASGKDLPCVHPIGRRIGDNCGECGATMKIKR